MKASRILIISICGVIELSCNNTNRVSINTSNNDSLINPKTETSLKASSPGTTVKEFLKYYNEQLSVISKIQMVDYHNFDSAKYYTLIDSEVEKYLNILTESHYISVSFINNLRQYIKQCGINFKVNKQYDGPPEGLDFDLIMLSNADYDQELALQDSITVIRESISGNKANVLIRFLFNDKLIYDLSRNGQIWQIDKIENVPFEER
jgi:hypothetical protein